MVTQIMSDAGTTSARGATGDVLHVTGLTVEYVTDGEAGDVQDVAGGAAAGSWSGVGHDLGDHYASLPTDVCRARRTTERRTVRSLGLASSSTPK